MTARINNHFGAMLDKAIAAHESYKKLKEL
ncbi:hypothetical protein [Enterobacter phage vB_EclM_AS6]|mgnify:CR=1 FL=1